MTINEIRELRQKRAALYDQAKAVRETAAKEKRELTAEERSKFDAILVDVDKLKVQIDDEERLLGIESELGDLGGGESRAKIQPGEEPGKVKGDEGKAKAYREAFSNWLKRGAAGITSEEANLLAAEARDLGTGAAGAGGNTVPAEFLKRLEVALKFYGGMLNEAEIIRTASGAPMSLPSANDTAVSGEIIAEGSPANTDASTPFGTLSIPVYLYSSKLIPVSLQLLQDSAFDVEQVVIDMIGERLGRIINAHFTVGTGSGQPKGIMVGATVGKTGAAGQVGAIIYDDLIDLEHSVDVAYRISGKCKFMGSDAMLKVIRKLKDSTGRPLWEPSIQVGQPDRLLRYPFVVNNDMAAPGASAKSLAFGDLTKYKVRAVQDAQVMRLTERLAEKHQVGFLGFQRFGGDLLDAGTNPVKVFQHPAS